MQNIQKKSSANNLESTISKTDRQTDRQTDRWTNRGMAEQMLKQTDGPTDRQMDGPTDRLILLSEKRKCQFNKNITTINFTLSLIKHRMTLLHDEIDLPVTFD